VGSSRPRTSISSVFTLADLERFPSRSQICFIECSGNGGPGYRDIRKESTPQQVDGLTSTSNWTGVPLSILFREVGVKPAATWFLAERLDAAVMARSIPVSKGWETSKYTDPLADCTARMFSFEMDAKSIITFPAHPVVLPRRGWWEITGLAWSGRGRITTVDVSTDGGRRWARAELHEPVLPKCHTRFRYLWSWKGEEAVLMSRLAAAIVALGSVVPALACAGGAGPTSEQPSTSPASAHSIIPAQAASEALPPRFGFGRSATDAEVKACDIDVMPDGTGLPPGRGTVAEAPFRTGQSARRPGDSLAAAESVGDGLSHRRRESARPTQNFSRYQLLSDPVSEARD
jgi:hypothetical protein